MLEMLNRPSRLPKPQHDPPTDVPRGSQMRIEPDCPPDQTGAALDVSTNRRNCVCGLGKSKRIILAELCRPCCQLDALGGFSRSINYPSVRLSLHIAIRRHGVCRCELWLDLNRLLKKINVLPAAPLTPLMQVVQPTQSA